jgi:ribosomal protein S18 acetylase RimI-like enzyme
MKLNEIVNKECFQINFEKQKQYKEFVLIAKSWHFDYIPNKFIMFGKQLRIEAKLNKQLVGWVNFEINDNKLEATDVVVIKEYRRKGIADAMYKFASELGNDIIPSSKQTPLGKAFWSKRT